MEAKLQQLSVELA